MGNIKGVFAIFFVLLFFSAVSAGEDDVSQGSFSAKYYHVVDYNADLFSGAGCRCFDNPSATQWDGVMVGTSGGVGWTPTQKDGITVPGSIAKKFIWVGNNGVFFDSSRKVWTFNVRCCTGSICARYIWYGEKAYGDDPEGIYLAKGLPNPAPLFGGICGAGPSQLEVRCGKVENDLSQDCAVRAVQASDFGPIYSEDPQGNGFALKRVSDINTKNNNDGIVVPSQVTESEANGLGNSFWAKTYRAGSNLAGVLALKDKKLIYRDLGNKWDEVSAKFGNPGKNDWMNSPFKPVDYVDSRGVTIKAPQVKADLPMPWQIETKLDNNAQTTKTTTNAMLCPKGDYPVFNNGRVVVDIKGSLVVSATGRIILSMKKANLNFRDDGECFPNLDITLSFLNFDNPIWEVYDNARKANLIPVDLRVGDFDILRTIDDQVTKYKLRDALTTSSVIIHITTSLPQPDSNEVKVDAHVFVQKKTFFSTTNEAFYLKPIYTTVDTVLNMLSAQAKAQSGSAPSNQPVQNINSNTGWVLQFPPYAKGGVPAGYTPSEWWYEPSVSSLGTNSKVYKQSTSKIIGKETISDVSWDGKSSTQTTREIFIKPSSSGIGQVTIKPKQDNPSCSDGKDPYGYWEINPPSFVQLYTWDLKNFFKGFIKPHDLWAKFDISIKKKVNVDLFVTTIQPEATGNIKGEANANLAIDSKKLLCQRSDFGVCCPALKRRLSGIDGASISTKSNSVYFIREANNFSYAGEAYRVSPPYLFNDSIEARFDNSASFLDFVIVKREDSILNECNYSVVSSFSKNINSSGGTIALGNFSEFMPENAVSGNLLMSIERLNILSCHCLNGIKDADEDGLDCGGSCGNVCQSTCYDSVKNGDEAGIDVGGSCVIADFPQSMESCDIDTNRDGVVNNCSLTCGDGTCEIGEYFNNCISDCGAIAPGWDGSFDNISKYIVPNVCGNSIIESVEECDDGNLVDGDGCNVGCAIEVLLSPEQREGIIDWIISFVKNIFR